MIAKALRKFSAILPILASMGACFGTAYEKRPIGVWSETTACADLKALLPSLQSLNLDLNLAFTPERIGDECFAEVVRTGKGWGTLSITLT